MDGEIDRYRLMDRKTNRPTDRQIDGYSRHRASMPQGGHVSKTFFGKSNFGNNCVFFSLPFTTAGGSGASSGASANINENTWTEFSFRADNNWNSCHGSKYVRKRTLDDGKIGQFVGAVLCSSTRYKLFLSDDLDGIFQ